MVPVPQGLHELRFPFLLFQTVFSLVSAFQQTLIFTFKVADLVLFTFVLDTFAWIDQPARVLTPDLIQHYWPFSPVSVPAFRAITIV